ncbi:glycosyltransferase family 2 protein [Lacticaseibacillus zhaodongensis]|uniref:glycosyltransferase family 2 protein n=1 Tax=Lacticaseibacillus zhaodongensis TaxID=2668065 RepID=UPI0012D32B94|nr:glycosyltransferase family 2 protein [Lacticaseibacillus zhaodongensis]
MTKTKRVIYTLAIVLSIIYLLWRCIFTIPWHATLPVLIFALMLVVSEVISNFTAYLLIAFNIIVGRNKKDKVVTPQFLPGAEVPDVDIIITTHNEDKELLRKTVNAATFIKYPQKRKVHVVIADDGNRPEVAALAKEYHVGYIGMEDNKQAKSGNINHALKQLHAPLFVIFDADMIPFSTFLEASVPYFTQNWREQAADPDNTKPLGFVQTPQSFYNADIFQFNLFSEQIVPNEQDFFSRGVNVLNGENNTALFTGSNAVFLRQAVEDAGGFPTDTLTEDFELGAKINIAGYTSLATEEPQSSGTTPIDLKGVIKQRTRWARGVMQSCRNLHIFLNPNIAFTNRLILINSFFYWWSFLRRLIYIAAPVLYALFKVQVVNANFWILMVVWAPGYFLLQYVLSDSSNKIRDERWGEVQETFFAPYLFIPVLLEFLGIKATKFKVTNKNATVSWQDRLYIVPYFLLWLITAIAVIKFNYGKWGSEILVGSVITFWLLTHLINLSFCLFIAMGRPVFRRSERFVRRLKGKLRFADGSTAEIMTDNVSEGGVAFSFTDATRATLKPGTPVVIVLKHGDRDVELSGKIVRQWRDDGKDYYSTTVTAQDADSRNHMLQIIYDGSNRNLSTKQDRWITPFDELMLNFSHRFKRIDSLITKLNRSNRHQNVFRQ